MSHYKIKIIKLGYNPMNRVEEDTIVYEQGVEVDAEVIKRIVIAINNESLKSAEVLK